MQIKVMQVGQLGINCYSLEDEETRTAAVVDPGGEGARILAQLKADGMELKLILLTHAHFDHTGGVAELCAALPGVPVYLHPADAGLVGGDAFPYFTNMPAIKTDSALGPSDEIGRAHV